MVAASHRRCAKVKRVSPNPIPSEPRVLLPKCRESSRAKDIGIVDGYRYVK